jgi:hypothetical protein
MVVAAGEVITAVISRDVDLFREWVTLIGWQGLRRTEEVSRCRALLLGRHAGYAGRGSAETLGVSM